MRSNNHEFLSIVPQGTRIDEQFLSIPPPFILSILHLLKIFKRLTTPSSFPSIRSTPSNFIASRNFLWSGSTHFHAISRGKLFVIAASRDYNATRHGEVRFTATITRIWVWYLRGGGGEGGRHRIAALRRRTNRARSHRCTCDSRTWFHLARRPVDPPRQVHRCPAPHHENERRHDL